MNFTNTMYELLSVALLCLIYHQMFGNKHGKVLLITYMLYLAAGVSNVLFVQKTAINSYTMFLSSLILITLSLSCFYKLIVVLPEEKLYKMPKFWINAGFLLYYAGTVFIYAFTPYLVEVLKNNLMVYWNLHNILNIVAHIFVMMGLYYDLRFPGSSDSPAQTKNNFI